MKTLKRYIIGSLACMALVVGINAANAGEITGNGKPVPGGETGKSECSYSGREDTPGDPAFRGVIAQSWGQLTADFKAFLASIGMHPGIACNPSGKRSQ